MTRRAIKAIDDAMSRLGNVSKKLVKMSIPTVTN